MRYIENCQNLSHMNVKSNDYLTTKCWHV